MTMPVQLSANGSAPGAHGKLDVVDDIGPPVTEEEASVAAKEAGLHVVDLRRVKNFRKLGKYLTGQGLVLIARGKALARAESLERAREKLVGLLDSEFHNDQQEVPEPIPVSTAKTILGISEALSTIVRVENETAELDLRLEKIARDDAPKVAPTNRAPPPGAAVMLTGTLEVKRPEEPDRALKSIDVQ